MSIKEREEFLFQKLREKDASIVADGVICEQEFLNARYKIVYILKEVNGGKSWDLWEAYELDLEKLLDYPVWYADYEELPQTPYRFSMWQYSSTGSVPGIEGNVDLNIQLLKK